MKNMSIKILILSLLMCAAFLTADAQEKSAGADKTLADKSKTVSVKKTISADEAAQNALNVGAKMPAFSLSDASGKTVASDDLLKKGNLVVVFYRGAWCPFCNLYLKKLQENLPQIQAQNANVVAISVESPDRSLKISSKNKVEFTVLSDPNLDTARKFGIVYELPQATNEKYIAGGLDLAKYNSTERAELPLSATYIINRSGEIVYVFLEPDYKKRAEPKTIIETLAKIK